MKGNALVCILGAATGVISSCGSGLTAYELRNAGHISPAGIPTGVDQFDPLPGRISSCLQLGQKYFGDLHATAEVATLDLASMSCEECEVRVTIGLPQTFIEDVRVGVVYGHLTLREPSDSVLEILPSICPNGWSKISSHGPICNWRRTADDIWESGTFGARVEYHEAYIASVNLQSSVMGGRLIPPDGFPKFGEPRSLEIDTTTGYFVGFVFSFSGYVGFVPTAVEAVVASDGKLLGCLPVSG